MKDEFGYGYNFRVLKDLTPEQRTAVYEAMKDKLGVIIKSGHDFGAVLQYLTLEQCEEVCEAMKGKLGDIIKLCFDFYDLLQHLTPEQCGVVCQNPHVSRVVAHLIKNTETDFLGLQWITSRYIDVRLLSKCCFNGLIINLENTPTGGK